MSNLQSQKEPFRKSQLTGLQSHPEPKPAEIYFVDLAKYENLVKIYSEVFQYLEKIAKSYPALEVGIFSSEVLHKIFINDFTDIEATFNGNIEKSLKGIPNPAIRATLSKDAHKPYRKFNLETELNLLQINRILRLHPGTEFNLDIYSIKAGVLSFNDEDKTRLKEKYCTYKVDSEARKQFKELTETALKSLQAIKAILLRNNIEYMFEDNFLFDENDAEVFLNKKTMGLITK